MEELALRMVNERHNPEKYAEHDNDTDDVTGDESPKNKSQKRLVGSGIELLQSGFKFRQQECRLRQNEVKKFISFLGDLGRSYDRFGADISKLSKDANNINNKPLRSQ